MADSFTVADIRPGQPRFDLVSFTVADIGRRCRDFDLDSFTVADIGQAESGGERSHRW